MKRNPFTVQACVATSGNTTVTFEHAFTDSLSAREAYAALRGALTLAAVGLKEIRLWQGERMILEGRAA